MSSSLHACAQESSSLGGRASLQMCSGASSKGRRSRAGLLPGPNWNASKAAPRHHVMRWKTGICPSVFIQLMHAHKTSVVIQQIHNPWICTLTSPARG